MISWGTIAGVFALLIIGFTASSFVYQRSIEHRGWRWRLQEELGAIFGMAFGIAIILLIAVSVGNLLNCLFA